jgi:aminoglycoside 6'-N-acetyltransferase
MGSSGLAGARVVLRPVGPADVDHLCRLFAEPEVARWWGRYDRGRIDRELVVGDDPTTTSYVIEVDGLPAGLIQSWEEPDPDYRRANIDIAVATRWHGTGVAVDAIRTLARHLVDACGHHHLTIDPAAGNGRAIACYRKVGFRPVGVLRRNERGPDGGFHDTLLMDMLAGELR